jgi:glycosyltransferase involved in cell wall biosynthesis
MEFGKVLIIVENNWVPVDRRVWYEATSLRDAGWKVSVICPNAAGAHAGRNTEAYRSILEEEDIDGITVHRFSLKFAEKGAFDFIVEYTLSFILIAYLSWKVWRRQGFDVLHICNPPEIFFPIGLFYRLLGAKFLFDHHDLFPEMIEGRFNGLKKLLFYSFSRITEYLTYKFANKIITTNQSYKEICVLRNGVKDNKVYIVRNGPKINEFNPVDPDSSLRRKFPYVACYVGIMGEDDGVSEFVDVIRYVIYNLKRRDILFILVGDGSDFPIVKQKVAQYDLNKFVDMPGMISNDLLLRRYMCSADILLSPEPWTPLNAHSTFIKIAEYMAMGKPIVAYELKESLHTAKKAAHFVKSGETDRYAKAIIDLLENKEKRRKMGEYGRRRVVEILGWEHQVQNLLRAYNAA